MFLITFEPRNIKLCKPTATFSCVSFKVDDENCAAQPVDMNASFVKAEMAKRLCFELHATFGVCDDRMESVIGVCTIHADCLPQDAVLNEHCEAIVNAKKHNELLGTIKFRFLIVLKHWFSFDTPTTSAYNSDKPYFIGHRGSGANAQGSRLRENTISSFNRTKQKLNAIELDVLLTKDNQLIVYHDIDYPVVMDVLEGRQRIVSRAPVCELNYKDLCRPKLKVRVTSTDDIEPAPYLSENPPLLSDVLKALDSKITGLVVEIKYVSNSFARKNPRYMGYSRSTIVNAVLDCLAQNWDMYLKNRWVIVSSFDPDICLLLAKAVGENTRFLIVHNCWFGHENEQEDNTVDFTDVRNLDPAVAIEQSAGINGGIAVEASYAMSNEFVKHRLHATSVPIFSYGSGNMHKNNILKQLDNNVSAFFIDNAQILPLS